MGLDKLQTAGIVDADGIAGMREGSWGIYLSPLAILDVEAGFPGSFSPETIGMAERCMAQNGGGESASDDDWEWVREEASYPLDNVLSSHGLRIDWEDGFVIAAEDSPFWEED